MLIFGSSSFTLERLGLRLGFGSRQAAGGQSSAGETSGSRVSGGSSLAIVSASGSHLEAADVQRKLTDEFQAHFGMNRKEAALLAFQLIGDQIKAQAKWFSVTISKQQAYRALQAIDVTKSPFKEILDSTIGQQPLVDRIS